MTKVEVKQSLLRGLALAALAALTIALGAGSARAQWTQPDASGNISTTNTGKVGIGTTAPAGKLAVNGSDALPDDTVTLTVPSGSVYGPSIKLDGRNGAGGRVWTIASTGVNNAGGAGKLRFYDITADATRMVLDGAGNVGIGTAAPQGPLQIGGYTSINNTSAPTHSQFINNAYFSGGWKYLNSDAASVLQIKDGLSYFTAPAGAAGAALTLTERLRIDNAGNVGVGTSAPASKLHVAGNITVDGNINAKYQDVAEWVPSTQKLSAGTVVVLDPRRSNHVLASTTSYDARVAGVVSAQPGIALGEAGEGKALVATTGRVKVRVDATHAPIQIGDLLVTSDAEGVAMKSEPINVGGRKLHAPGTIIGKALEPLEKGTGEILVLLSLQ